MLLMWIHPYLPLPSSPFPSVIRTERRRFIIVCINYASERERRPRDHLWSSLQWIEERIRNQQRRTTGLKTRQMMMMIVIHCITCFPCYSSCCCCPFVEICMSLYILFRFSSRSDSMVVWYALIVYTFVIEYFAVDLNRKSFLSFTRDIHAISWSIHRWILFLMSCPSLFVHPHSLMSLLWNEFNVWRLCSLCCVSETTIRHAPLDGEPQGKRERSDTRERKRQILIQFHANKGCM